MQLLLCRTTRWIANELGGVFGPALAAAVGTVGGIFRDKSARDDSRQAARDKLELEKEMLLFRKSLAEGGEGGGGGGGAGPFLGFTDPQRLTAKQNQNKQMLDAINSLIASYHRTLLGNR